MIKYLLSILFILVAVIGYSQNKLDKQGHRGCRGLMPENTIPAMKKAMDLGVNTLEMDVVISKDKLPLISHEPFMSATIATAPNETLITSQNEHSFNLYELNYSEIRRFDVGIKAHPGFPKQQKLKAYKPLLSELIDSAEAYAKSKKYPPPFYNIETKSKPQGDGIFHPQPDEFVKIMMQVIVQKGISKRITIQSFDPRTLEIIHKNYPEYQTALLSEKAGLPEQELQKLSFKPDVYSPFFKELSQQTIEAWHKNNIKIIPWTVNTEQEIDRLVKLGVDGIITDYPDLFNRE